MRFVPNDASGKRKRGVPFVGDVERGYEDGQIVLLPLESRWESWWELVDKKSVPKKELERDQKKRDAYVAKAELVMAERAEQLRRDESPATVLA